MKNYQLLYYRILLIAFVLSSIDMNCQNNFIDNNVQQSIQNISSLINSKNIYKTTEGSPYINEVFYPATIKNYSNTYFFARYNAYNGEMEIKVDDEVYALNESTENLEIKFQQSNKIYKVFYYIDSEGNGKKDFLVIVKSTKDYSLLKQERITYVQGKKAISGYEFNIPNRFERQNDNYFLKIQDKIVYLSTNKRELCRSFPNDSKRIKSYIKKNKISLKKEEDLITLASFLTAL